MPHFCGRTHSARDRREALVSDDPRQRAEEPPAPGESKLAPTGAASRGATSALTGATTLIGPSPAPGAATARGATSALGGAPAQAAVAPGPTGRTAPTQEQIAALAYSYWEARGRQGGSPEADWLRAEKELRSR